MFERQHFRLSELTHDQLKAIVDAIPVGVVAFQRNGSALLLNTAAYTLLGSEPGRLAPHVVRDMFPILGQILTGRSGVNHRDAFQMNVIRSDGTTLRCQAWAAHNSADELALTCAFCDTSDELRDRELDRMDSLNRFSSLVIDAAMHEVRNLASAALMVFDQIEARVRGLGDASQVHAAATLLRRITVLTSEGLLRRHDSIALCVNTLDVVPVLEDVRTIAEPVCSACRIRMMWDVPADLPTVVGDRDAILQVLLNLLRNSVRALSQSAERTIILHASHTSPDTVSIRVQDSGPGVAHPETLFTAHRAGADVHGSGLGLFISKALARACSGDLQYEDAQRGACFRLDLLTSRTDKENG